MLQSFLITIGQYHKNVIAFLSTITLGYIGIETAQHIYYALASGAAIFTITNVIVGWVKNYNKTKSIKK